MEQELQYELQTINLYKKLRCMKYILIFNTIFILMLMFVVFTIFNYTKSQIDNSHLDINKITSIINNINSDDISKLNSIIANLNIEDVSKLNIIIEYLCKSYVEC